MATSRAGTSIIIPQMTVDTIMRCDIDHIRGIPISGIMVIANTGHMGIAHMVIFRTVCATNLIGCGVDSATIVEKTCAPLLAQRA